MHIRDGSEYTIVVSGRKHQASFLDVGQTGEFLFSITSRDHPYLKSHSGSTGHLLVTIGGTRYVYTGRVTSMDEHHAAVFSPLLIGPDRRTTDRYPVPSVSCRLKEKGFLRPRVSTVFIVNISTGGAAVSCSGPLEVSKVCELETSLVVHRAPRDCSAVVSVRYCRPEKSHYICGVRFEEMTPSCRDTLEKFVRRLREEG